MKRSSRRQIILWCLGALFLFALYRGLGFALTFRVTLRQLREDGRTLYQEIRTAGLPNPDTAGALRRDVENLERSLHTLEGALRYLPAPRWWPWLNRRVGCLRHSLRGTVDLTTALWWALLRLESAADYYGLINTATGVPIMMREDPLLAALASLSESKERLLRAQEHLTEAGHLAQQAGGRFAALAPYAEAVAWGARALTIASYIMREGEHTFLLLVQNSDELRATGGFISGVVVMRFDGARLLSAEYRNSYDIPSGSEAPTVPDPLQEIMLAPILVFRDANWSPDFPTSAQVLASLYESGTGETVSGIAAIDTTFVKVFLRALGPITVPGYEVTITPENAIEVAIGFWEAPLGAPSLRDRQTDFQAWLEHRKDFGAAVLKALLERARTLSLGDWVRLTNVLGPAIREKHFFLWAAHLQAQQTLESFGMAGALVQGGGDYLLVVDTNVGWNKVDRHIARAIAYEVTLGPSPEGRACLTYRNEADVHLERCEHRAEYLDSYEALTKQCYWNYVRVYVPRGSELVHTEGAESQVRTGEEVGKRILETLLVVPPQEERVLCLTYRLPSPILDHEGNRAIYRLTVQKQAGLEGTPLMVAVRVPQGTLAAPPPWEALGEQTLVLNTRLEADFTSTILWERP